MSILHDIYVVASIVFLFLGIALMVHLNISTRRTDREFKDFFEASKKEFDKILDEKEESE